MKANGKAGFTIVELLIVIVVIAILAAISVVAYTGIQQRATTAALSSAVNQWEKTLRSQALLDAYVINDSDGVCLGNASDYPAANGFPAGVCVMQDGAPLVTYSESAYVNWPTGTRPQGGTPVTELRANGATVKARGAYAYGANRQGVNIAWVPQVSGECLGGQHVDFGAAPGSLNGGLCAKGFLLQ